MLRGAILLLLAGLLLLPVVLRRGGGESAARRDGVRQLIIITPHNEQIRSEFGEAFERWHEARHGEPVRVVWNVPGGTSEIRRMLQSQASAALRDGRPLGGNADLFFGGGSYEYNELKRPISAKGSAASGASASAPASAPAPDASATVLAPIDFGDAFLRDVYGPDQRIGDEPLYDPQGHWFGTALSGFGIVYNRDLLARLGVPEPHRWRDLTDPRLFGAVALVNPAQSGSITTAFEAILQRRGWDEGWRTLRRAAANARSFSASSSKVPIDVAAGEAAAGICIDFYGRFESQAIRDAGGGDRVGYVDPAGETQLDADPIAMLRGAPSPDLARRFIEFVLSVEGQSLWQLPPRGSERAARAGATDDLGPAREELRRMPIRRSMYADPALFARFVDQVDPWTIATRVEKPDRNMRAFIATLFSAMAIEEHDLLRQAWRAIVEHPAYPDDAGGMVHAKDVDDPTLRRMLEAFDAMPDVPGPDGAPISLAPGPDLAERLAAVRNGWFKEGWRESGLWSPESTPADAMRRHARRFFEARYREVLELARRSM